MLFGCSRRIDGRGMWLVCGRREMALKPKERHIDRPGHRWESNTEVDVKE
jgi:hypothetical protein